MAKGVLLLPERVINGSFGELVDDSGVFQAHAQGITFQIIHDTRTWKSVGTRRISQKITGSHGEGTIEQLKVSSATIAKLAGPLWDINIPITPETLTVNLDDPESYTYEQVILTGLKFLNYDGGWSVNQVVMEKLKFSFYSILIPNQIPHTDGNLYNDADLISSWNTQKNL